MATTQQLLDLKYGRQMLEDRARLSELFSEELLGALFAQNRNNISDILDVTYIGIGYQDTTNPNSFKGIEYLNKLQTIGAAGTTATTMNLSSLVNLVFIDLLQAQSLTTIGSLLKLTKLTHVYITASKITSLGSIIDATLLDTLILTDNKLTAVDFSFNSLEVCDLSYNNFPTSNVDKVLLNAKTAKQGGSPLITLNLGGSSMGIPTGGAANADYVWLINNGVTVTIRTA